MLLSFILDPVTDMIGEIMLFWSKSDTERVKSIQRARSGVLASDDGLLVDSTKGHLLLCTKAGMYLVSRRRAWKATLTDQELALYEKQGRRMFPRIGRNRQKVVANPKEID